MKVVNETHLRLGWVVTGLRPPELTGTFVVKGSYALRPDGVATPLGEPERPTGDIPEPEAPEGCLAYASDLAPLKPRTDLLLVGRCFPPGGGPVTVCPVTFQVGSWRKSLLVIGDRIWKRGGLGMLTPTAPEPFTDMKLSWSRSFGGPGVARNPAGCGRHAQGDGQGHKIQRMPNIEDPRRLVSDPGKEYEPVGFGPIAAEWPPRAPRQLNLSRSYFKERWPWFPEDFDFAYFNAAPVDQQLPEPLRGDETLVLEGLYPGVPRFEGRLAAERPQLFLLDGAEQERRAGERGGYREVLLQLDTLVVDTEKQQLLLVWRGLAPVQHIKMKDLAEAHVLVRPLHEPAWTVDAWTSELTRRDRLAIETAAEEAKAEEEAEAAEARKEAEAEASLAAIEKAAAVQQKELELEADEILKRHGLSLASLSAPSTVAWKDLAGILAREAATAGVRLSPEVIALVQQAASLEVEPVPDDDAEEEVPWTLERFAAADKAGQSFAEAELAGLDLSGYDLSDRNFEGANFKGALLEGCRFDRARLAGAVLAGARLAGASFAAADLSNALLSGAELAGASFRGARLERAILTKIGAAEANFDETEGRIADFAGADLTASTFRGSRLVQPDFRGATLSGADWSGAQMPQATLEAAVAPGLNVSGADLTGLRATKAKDLSALNGVGLIAPGSIWVEAQLKGANFEGAQLSRASFASAILIGARFDRANLPGAVFEEAQIEAVNFTAANIFRGSFERAACNGVDFRRANLYEVEFWQARLDRVLFEGANLKMTKLAER